MKTSFKSLLMSESFNVSKVEKIDSVPHKVTFSDGKVIYFDTKEQKWIGTSTQIKMINDYLNESLDASLDESSDVRKGIFYDSKGKMALHLCDADGYLTTITWEQYKKSELKDESSENSQKEFLSSLLNQVKQFNVKVDYNTWVKKSNPSWEEKVDYLIKNCGVKYTKAGIK